MSRQSLLSVASHPLSAAARYSSPGIPVVVASVAVLTCDVVIVATSTWSCVEACSLLLSSLPVINVIRPPSDIDCKKKHYTSQS